MNDKYILDDDWNPVPEPDLIKWGQWLQYAKRSVAHTIIGESRISTVFLGLDHSFGDGPPVLWETMVFGDGKLTGEQDRCTGNREQAEAMHQRMIERVKNASDAKG